jgi:hypothetical protein
MPSPNSSILLAIFVLCCLLSSFRILKDTPTHFHSDTIARASDQRFAALKAALPRRGTVGYIGDPGNLSIRDYYLTQYALAPLVVDHSIDHPLVIANFSNSPPAAPENLHLVKDFGAGVQLLTRKNARNTSQDTIPQNSAQPAKDLP